MGVYLHGVSNRIKRADSTHCCFHLVRFPNARRFNFPRDTVDCQINIPIIPSIIPSIIVRFCWKKTPQTPIVFFQGARIGKLVNTCGVIKQSGRDGSVLNRSPQWSHIENQDVQSQLDVEDALSNVFESNAAGVTNFSIV